MLRSIHKMTALCALTLSDADVPPLFPPIHIHDLTVLYVKHVVVTMLVLRVSLLLLFFLLLIYFVLIYNRIQISVSMLKKSKI